MFFEDPDEIGRIEDPHGLRYFIDFAGGIRQKPFCGLHSDFAQEIGERPLQKPDKKVAKVVWRYV